MAQSLPKPVADTFSFDQVTAFAHANCESNRLSNVTELIIREREHIVNRLCLGESPEILLTQLRTLGQVRSEHEAQNMFKYMVKRQLCMDYAENMQDAKTLIRMLQL